MRILLVADTPCKALWDYYQPDRLENLDLIISCGDLKQEYLEFLVTMGRVPLLYVPGNHDTGYLKRPPEGCECLDDQVITYGGLRFMGLGGSPRYNTHPFQYTEKEMEKRIRHMRRSLRRSRGVDIVVTHAAVAGYGDAEDYAHRGFACFRDLMDQYHPRFLVHGHVHQSYQWDSPRVRTYGNTTIINAYERYILEI